MSEIQREWQHLFDLFEQRLLAQRPASVLDVGCGRGTLVQRLSLAGIPATGVDPTADGTHPQIIAAAADKLPFDDNAFEWVTLRHVPHHLPDVQAAFTECARVARKGLLIAEPWFDTVEPAQRTAERWDLWWKRQHERAGQIHRPCLTLLDLQAALPPGFKLAAEHYRRPAEIPVHAIQELARPLAAQIHDSDPDAHELEAIMEQGRGGGFSYNGTLIVTALKA